MKNTLRRLSIFCGTGGVGKTTLSYCYALSLAKKSNKTLIITIDPAIRLKDFIKTLPPGEKLDVIVFDPLTTFKSLNPDIDLSENRILKLLMSRYGGMNEILSLVEVSKQFKNNKYDHIVMDTPPGRHFLDFLNSTKKIQSFFSKVFIDVLQYITQKQSGAAKRKNIFKMVLDTSLDKLMGYLEKVTGDSFLKEFLEAISVVYNLQSSFLETLKFNDILLSPELSQWFLVTSSEQNKYHEAKDLMNSPYFSEKNSFAVLNKTNAQKIKKDLNNSNLEHKEKEILQSFLDHEQSLYEALEKDFLKVLSFEEIISNDLPTQVQQLTEKWEQYDL